MENLHRKLHIITDRYACTSLKQKVAKVGKTPGNKPTASPNPPTTNYAAYKENN